MPQPNESLERRTLFNQVAVDYDAIRPGYPEELIADILGTSGLPPTGRILEIGCGTGQATLPFARRGYKVLCLEIGQQLADIAARHCAPYPKVEIQIVAFEDWQVEQQAFDLVLSATAFHWIPPEIGYSKAAQALKDTGWIAICANEHPLPPTGFFADVQSIYQSVLPEWKPISSAPSTDQVIHDTTRRIAETGLFEPALVRTYPWSQQYTAKQYIQLLNTYSNHHSLEAGKRSRLFAGIHNIIEQGYGGVITKQYLAVLYMAKQKHSSRSTGAP